MELTKEKKNKFPQTLSLVTGPSNNNEWCLRSLLSVIQVLTVDFKIPLTSWEVNTVRVHPFENLCLYFSCCVGNINLKIMMKS